ncbi:WRC-like protein [Artemisia annua]|uniref:WRC-like protein n=1 Tax=Artemisia annua TaxID=35608 RepID=A0A2U1LUD7_ARTAN|nr:WRC-like protein [Artemisia annua]
MRIRKRFLSLLAATAAPLSSISHVEDEVQPIIAVQHPEVHPNSSDHTTKIGLQPVSSGACSDSEKTKEMKFLKMKDIIKTDDTGRKERIVCEEAKSHDLGWFQGDKLVPTKKRRGSLGKNVNHDHQEDNVGTLMKPTPKKSKKNEKRGDVILEGSRCSRVNGRGWRCGQQTLVGYSLCEHHLGKGRLRSMTSVRGQAQKVALKEDETIARQNEDIETKSTHHHTSKEFKFLKLEPMSSAESSKKFSKQKKVGVVKERSLSSLLSQLGN